MTVASQSQHYGNGVSKQQDNVPAPGEEGDLGHFAALPHGIHHFPAHTSCSLPVGHAVRLCMQDTVEHAQGQGGKTEHFRLGQGSSYSNRQLPQERPIGVLQRYSRAIESSIVGPIGPVTVGKKS